ncbi:MAG: DUF2059 domain-containing protein [Parasphingorhabdus sp.]|nr:DUF2059 domain-containing protein [Parasphingorhabdus sp.]
MTKIWTALSFAMLISASAVPAATPEAAQVGDFQAAPVDPARLAVAKVTVDYLFPIGTYERMMKGTFDKLMDSMMTSVMGMSAGDLGGMAGASDEEMKNVDPDATIGDMAKQADPHFEERMRISTRVMMDEMVTLISSIEPQVRDALSNIYARKYDARQLNEMNAFFKTDTGGTFARDYMMAFVDPEMLQSMMSMVPKMMQEMPKIVEKVKVATAHLPPPPKSEAELAADAAADAVEAVDAGAGDDAIAEETGEEPWYDQQNWTAAQRKQSARLEARYNAASEKSSVAYDAWDATYQAAVSAARERLKPGYDASQADIVADPETTDATVVEAPEALENEAPEQ